MAYDKSKQKRESNGKLKVGETKNGQKRLEGFLQIGDKSYFIDVYKKSAEVLAKYPSDWTHTIYVKEQTKRQEATQPQQQQYHSKSEMARVEMMKTGNLPSAEAFKKAFAQPDFGGQEDEGLPF